jgi:hypothetical protein
LSLVRAHVTQRAKPQKDTPDWVKSLVCQDPDDPDSFSPPHFIMIAHVDPLSSLVLRDKVGYYKLDASQKLSVLLQNKHFVEYPTIEVWEEFHGTIVDAQGTIIHYAEEERPPKRRRLDLRAGRKAMRGLVGGYRSDSEERTDRENVLSMLGGYVESEGDGVEETPDEDSEEEDGCEGGDDLYVKLDTARLLQSMRETDEWIDGSRDEQVDYGGSDEEG